jgi:hypothetical protein
MGIFDWLKRKKNGLQKSYYENGQIKLEENWKDDKKDGLQKSYYENGQIKLEENWKDHKKDGLQKSYYENGQLEEESTYKNDKEIGLVKSYYQNGQLALEGNVKNDKYDGSFKSYYENGQLKSEGNMNKGEESGIWKEYNEDGEVEEINYDSVSENEQVELPLYLTKYAGFEGIQLYLNERVNFAGIFDRFNMGLHKGEKIEDMIKIISNNYNNEQKTNIKKGFFDVFQLLGTLSKEEEKTLIKIKQPQIKEEFEKRFGSSKPIPDGLDVVLIALHPDVKDTLQELIEKL